METETCSDWLFHQMSNTVEPFNSTHRTEVTLCHMSGSSQDQKLTKKHLSGVWMSAEEESCERTVRTAEDRTEHRRLPAEHKPDSI